MGSPVTTFIPKNLLFKSLICLIIFSSLPSRANESSLPMHGFADVNLSSGSKADPDQNRGFSLGAFDLYFTPNFNNRARALIEFVIEPEDGAYVTEVERLQIGYLFSDKLMVWLGRFHTPYGYWNTAFHHGQQIQTSSMRPRFLDFEDNGGIFPSHSVGVLLTGSGKTSIGRFSYDGYFANGSSIIDEEQNPNIEKDDNSNGMVGFNTSITLSRFIKNLRLGLHGWMQKVSAYTTLTAPAEGLSLDNTTDTQVYGGYIQYEDRGLEIISEYYQLADKNVSTGANDSTVRNSSAFFVQTAFVGKRFTPFIRYETTNLDLRDPYISSQRSGVSYGLEAIGVRYVVDEYSVLKIEFAHTEQFSAGGVKYNLGKVQYAIRF